MLQIMLGKLFLLFVAFILSSCIMDRNTGVVVINNDTNSSILLAKQPNQNITDSLVFLNDLDKAELISGEIRNICLPYSNLQSLPSNEKAYLYIFNIDSLEKYRKSKKVDGIMDLCLIDKYSIQLNKVKDELDTIYVSK